MTDKKHGPEFMRLVFMRASVLAIPPGGGLAAGVEFWTDEDKRKRIMRESFDWALLAVEAVKSAPDNPFGDNEENIAMAVLENFEQRKGNSTP